jgi:hypothetical protein
MDIKATFRKTLNDIELYSNEDLGGDFELRIGQMLIPTPINVSETIKGHPELTPEIIDEMNHLYSQIRELSVFWDLYPSSNDKHLKFRTSKLCGLRADYA